MRSRQLNLQRVHWRPWGLFPLVVPLVLGCTSSSVSRESTTKSVPAQPKEELRQVTGSYLPVASSRQAGRENGVVAPVTVYDAREIERSGRSDVASFLRTRPGFR